MMCLFCASFSSSNCLYCFPLTMIRITLLLSFTLTMTCERHDSCSSERHKKHRLVTHSMISVYDMHISAKSTVTCLYTKNRVKRNGAGKSPSSVPLSDGLDLEVQRDKAEDQALSKLNEHIVGTTSASQHFSSGTFVWDALLTFRSCTK